MVEGLLLLVECKAKRKKLVALRAKDSTWPSPSRAFHRFICYWHWHEMYGPYMRGKFGQPRQLVCDAVTKRVGGTLWCFPWPRSLKFCLRIARRLANVEWLSMSSKPIHWSLSFNSNCLRTSTWRLPHPAFTIIYMHFPHLACTICFRNSSGCLGHFNNSAPGQLPSKLHCFCWWMSWDDLRCT